MRFIIHVLVTAVAFLAVSRIVPGFKIKDFTTAVIVSFVYGLLSGLAAVALLVLGLITLPAWIMALPLIAVLAPILHPIMLVVSFLMTWGLIVLTDWLIEGFHIDDQATAAVGALVFSIVNGALTTILF